MQENKGAILRFWVKPVRLLKTNENNPCLIIRLRFVLPKMPPAKSRTRHAMLLESCERTFDRPYSAVG